MSSDGEEYNPEESDSGDSDGRLDEDLAREKRATKPFVTRDFLLGLRALWYTMVEPSPQEVPFTSDEQHARETLYLKKTKDGLFTPGVYEVTNVILDRLIMHGLPSFAAILMLLGQPRDSPGSST